MAKASLFQRLESAIAPKWALQRKRSRMALDLLQRSYEGATTGRRSQGWKKSNADANAVNYSAIGPMRMVARSLVENNPYAESALSTIADHAVGWGISPTEAPEIWKKWAETTACDADGRNDLYGLTKLVVRTAVESGECLVRKRMRRPGDGFPLPMQLQVLEPDYIDTLKDQIELPNGGRITQGVEFNAIGQRVAYWLFREHPGSMTLRSTESQRIPAEGVLHVYRIKRAGQVRGVTWFAPVILRFKDFDDFEDATLMKQKIAACLAVLVTDADGAGAPLGVGEADSQIDSLEPGMIRNIPPGQTVTVVDPPNVRDYDAYTKNQLRAIATGLGVSYEDLTGDYTGMPFSAARMSRLRHQSRVEDWRWQMIVPQFLDPVWAWMVEVAGVMGIKVPEQTEWNAPPLPFIDPAAEGQAIMKNVRSGIQTLKQAIRERGLNYEEHLDELAQDFKELDRRGLKLDIDPRFFTHQGQMQSAASVSEPAPTEVPEDEET